jgi:phage terminase large subunit GpA-like protein
MLQNLGVDFITSSLTNTKKTGDLTYSKEFDGGNLDGVTANSTAALASETKKLGVGDEISKWKKTIGDEAGPWDQLWARLKAWLDEKKALAISTPTDEETCLVNALFLTGTQEEWFVPCPICGKHQILDIRHRDGYGLNYRTKNGNIIESSVEYVCQHCSRSFKEKHKFNIQQDGYWESPPGVEPVNQYTTSFHLHSINSMFESWLEIATAYEKGLDNPIAKKAYDNLVAGQPHKQSGVKMESTAIMENKGEYPRQTVPDGVILLTMGGDVQRGGDRWQEFTDEELQDEIKKARKAGDIHERKFPRIEIEVFGTGPSYRGWSIDYQVFYGRVDNAFTGAWEQLNQWAVSVTEKNQGFGFRRESDGQFFPIVRVFLDSGYLASVVYQFSSRWGLTFPIKGARQIDPPKNEKNRALHDSNFIRYRESRVDGGNTKLFTIGTKYYKDHIYNLLAVKRIPGLIQAPGFQDFPRDYKSRYFDMLTAEEKLHNGEYDAKGRASEALDCRVYSACAADAYLDQYVEEERKFYKSEHNYSDQKLKEEINSRWAILKLARQAGIDERFLITKSGDAEKDKKK